MSYPKSIAYAGFLFSFVLPLLISSDAHAFGYPPVNGNSSAALTIRDAAPAGMRAVHFGPPAVSHTPPPAIHGPAFPTGEVDRESIRSMHILDRPDRPFHFYGNTVRFFHRMSQQTPEFAY